MSGLTISNGRGGIANLQGTLMISNSVISGNSGAGIGNSGTLTITNSTISDNSGSFFGGGISNSGTMTIANSTIARNLCFEKGGGIYNLGDPFDPFNPSVMRIINSTLFRNVVTNPSVGGGGGGIFNESATLMVTNSTISRNIVIGGSGVGIVTNDPGPVNSVSVKSSIIASNFQSQPDVIGPFTSAGFNLIGNVDGSTGFTHPTDQTGTDASPLNPGFETDSFGLPLLKDNGGPTHTIALLSQALRSIMEVPTA
ncbi:MAG: right-handed parallel beta-helix repeat-containing protein [Pyrinomonadaceae bacterium]|nr:right-handed parallel beta-helix repeat-containing protein [Pyrinomonadaceae bacterium]